MCCLFGFHDYGHQLTRKQRSAILSILSTECEERGTDATGIAYNVGGRMRIYKRPLPAHLMWYRVPLEATVVMGHTRMTTQGSEKRNENNHPFAGTVADGKFALAHNGVLYNDKMLRKQEKLPVTRIETDSYVAAQLVEKAGLLTFQSLRSMAEKLEGSFTFTALSEWDELYFVKGNNPMCVYHFPEKGVYLYASTEQILLHSIRKLPFNLGQFQKVQIFSGDLLRIDAHGDITRSNFDDEKLYALSPWFGWPRYEPVRRPYEEPEETYLSDLKAVAVYYGLYPEDIDALIRDGVTTDEIEEMLYCG